MSQELDFSQDSEFRKLLEWRTDVDLTVAALELARDAYPGLDFLTTQNWIKSCGDELRSRVLRTTSELEAVEIVAKHISIEHGIVGSGAAYRDADSSYLNRIIETKQGIPISLTLLHIAVCHELNVDLQPVGSPRHFLARVDTPDGPFFLDAFAGSRILSESATIDWLEELTSLPRRDITRNLQPVAPRVIISRMLNNLKVLYAHRENWEATWKVQSRLTALSPSDYAEKRDLALVAMKTQRSATAIRLLKSLLEVCQEDDRLVLQAQLAQAEREIHLWN